ncbi:TRAF-like family protein [Raphanus sativus]|uniref:MATH domain and coiled-coil domain-containing protein At3g58410-like n=1 Tax=Raphanus sativus TaxID=3726 RepID=A0A6J0N8I7_RAPSA|nr:MATH domain and coiled-coil domain-containing protein At3g58410-like [Raphanus sativus]XP_056863741.1 MATH domain and coiled-coil domain-containing protein At3g58410-like [Raphanus sativus]KAJ4904931.1 TRAF-like family protein [Raphanus sativus]
MANKGDKKLTWLIKSLSSCPSLIFSPFVNGVCKRYSDASDKSEKESMDVSGFHVLPSQVESVRLIFKRHPDIAVEFRAKNQHLRKACMDFLLSLIETLCQSLEELSSEDLVEADVALTYLKDAGFKVEWLEKKLDHVKAKKEKEQFCVARLQEMEDSLLNLWKKCSDLDAQVEKEEEELSATRTPLSFDDAV